MPGINNTSILFKDVSNLCFITDSSIAINTDTNTTSTQLTQPIIDTLRIQKFKSYDQNFIDSIFKLNEQREIQIQEEREVFSLKFKIQKTDTSKLLFEHLNVYKTPLKERFNQDLFYQNFLYNLPVSDETESVRSEIVIIENQAQKQQKKETNKIITEKKLEIEHRIIGNKLHFDWIFGVLLLSFIILGFVKLVFNKYLLSLIKSAVSFQEASTMFREKNTLMEKASFFVNLLFLSNISIFVIQLAQFYNVEFGTLKHYLVYLFVFTALFILYIYRAITSWFIGSVFLKQKIFKEYFHNLNIFTKNTGLFLFPIVVTLQFLSYEYLAIIVYIGIIGVAMLYLMQIQRSFQLINRKNVSVFYMILYLCAFEFAPLLIIYKLLLSLN